MFAGEVIVIWLVNKNVSDITDRRRSSTVFSCLITKIVYSGRHHLDLQSVAI